MEMLLGSSVQPSSFIDRSGKVYVLGDIVREAHQRSGLSVEEWNRLAREEEPKQEAMIAAVVKEWELQPA